MLIPFVLGAVQIVLYFKYPSTPPFLPTEVNQKYTMPNIEAVINSSQSDSIKYRKKRLAELRRRKIDEIASQGDTNKVNLQNTLVWAEGRGKIIFKSIPNAKMYFLLMFIISRYEDTKKKNLITFYM